MRSTIQGNDIDGAFNKVRHECLRDLVRLSRFPTYLVNWTDDFCSNRTLSCHFDGDSETPKIFDSGSPQSSPYPQSASFSTTSQTFPIHQARTRETPCTWTTIRCSKAPPANPSQSNASRRNKMSGSKERDPLACSTPRPNWTSSTSNPRTLIDRKSSAPPSN